MAKATPFRLIDEYARKRHQSFLAEMFLNKNETEYILCFRPAAASRNSDRNACRYLHLEVGKISPLEKAQELGNSMKTLLDQELALFSSSS